MTRRLAAACASVAWLCGPAFAAPALWSVEREHVGIELRAMTPGVTVGGELELTDERDATETRLAVAWPEGAPPATVVVRARLGPPLDDGRIVLLEAAFVDAPEHERAVTRIPVVDSATGLLEVARRGDSVLTLAASLERSITREVTAMPPVGRAVRFRVEVQRVDAGRATSLETNRLQSFIGRTVGYEFRLGPAGEAAAARLRLTPVELRDAVLVLDVELDGTLPAEPAPELLARRERLFSSTGATSTVALESGDPPSGYRLLVTPEF